MESIVEWVDKELTSVTEKSKGYVKKSLIDFVAVSITALEEPLYLKLCQYVSVNTKGDVPLLGTTKKSNSQHAALALGALSHAIDYDDISSVQIGHPTVVLAPILFSLGYEEKSSGKELLEAYIAGYEVIARISKGAARIQYERGWHTTSTIGVIGGTICAARLLKLTREQTANAIGMACSFASGVRANFGTMTKPLHAGWAASNAIFAVKMAQNDFESSEDSFDGLNSYLTALGGELDDNVWKQKNLFIDEGLILKPYPSCGLSTRIIDCGLELHEKVKARLDEIESITCFVSPLTLKVLKYPRPTSGLQAKFSLEYCAAQSIISGEMKMHHFTDAHIKNSRSFKKIIQKVNYEIPKDMEEFLQFGDEYSAITITFKNGDTVTSKIFKPKGYPQNPLTANELQEKFNDCTKNFLTKTEQTEIYNNLANDFESNDRSSLVDDINHRILMKKGKGVI